MRAQLQYEHDGKTRSFRLSGDELTIGRTEENDLMIPDGSISRRHARLSRKDGVWYASDLGSKNGTFQGEIGRPPGELRHGDTLILGQLRLRYLEDDSEAPGESVESGTTMVRHAIDFKALAKGGSRAPGEAQQAELDRTRRLLSVVTRVSEALLASRPLDETLQVVLDLVFDHLLVERGAILLRDEAGQLQQRASRQRAGGGRQLRALTVSRTIAEKVTRERVSVMTVDAQADPRFAGGLSIVLQGIRSAMAAPLWVGDRVDGLIYVDTTFHVQAFDEFDLDLLSALANHAAIAIETARLQDSVLGERMRRERLERYHSPAVIERIRQAGQAGEAFAADEREVTVLFADVVGFTNRCERLEAREVARILNRCFSRMSEAIFQWDGTLDKFIGDCLMAVFGAPLPMEDHAARAAQAALDMRRALDELNQEMPESERLQFRVGMSSGRVVAGDIGSVRRSDFTVLGATVNLAARLESIANPGQILMSDVTEAALRGRFVTTFALEAKPKGISRVVRCYELIGALPQTEELVPGAPR